MFEGGILFLENCLTILINKKKNGKKNGGPFSGIMSKG